MIKPIQQAPQEFMKRYERLENGEEVIDSVEKLQEFWLFAWKQGLNHREMREYIAQLAYEVPIAQPIDNFTWTHPKLHEILISWEDFMCMEESPIPGLTTEQWHDYYWNEGKNLIENIDAKKLDAIVPKFYKKYSLDRTKQHNGSNRKHFSMAAYTKKMQYIKKLEEEV